MKHWINTVSKDHAMRGVAGGFTQANHGKITGLKRMDAGDRIVFYSPKQTYTGNEPLQAFTAIGTVADDKLYQVEVSPAFIPWRRNVVFEQCNEAPIKPLLDKLEFITDKAHWGYMFRFGLFEISEADFNVIEQAMNPQVIT